MNKRSPTGWLRQPLGVVTREENERVGRGHSPTVLSSTKYHGLVPSDEYFKNRTIYSTDLSNYKQIRAGWFAYATNHLAEGSIGIYRKEQVACTSPIYTVFSCTQDVWPEYLFRLLKTPELLNQYRIYEHASVDRRGAVRYKDFARIEVDIPPAPEQRRIAEILDILDEAIRKTEQLIDKLKQVKQGLLHDLLTCGIDENGKLRDPKRNPEQFKKSPLGQIPMEWAVVELGSVLDGIDAGKSPSCPDQPAAPGQWGVLKVSAVRPEGFQPQENKVLLRPSLANPAYEVRNGDLLITRANTSELVGLMCLVQNPPPRLLLCDKTLRLRLSKVLYPQYLFFASQMPYVRSQIEMRATGSSGSMKNISQRAITELRILLPGLTEQARITQRLKSMDDCLRSSIEEKEKLRLLKQGLMEDILTGRVRVTALLNEAPP